MFTAWPAAAFMRSCAAIERLEGEAANHYDCIRVLDCELYTTEGLMRRYDGKAIQTYCLSL